MAYLSPHFEQDVFVSYSHGHPGGAGALKEWTFELLRRLKGDILDTDHEFNDLVIWWDKDLDPTLQLTPELKAKVRSSGILLIIMSPHYLTSGWCKDELTWFSEQIQDRLQDPERVFIIRAVRTDKSKWPAFLRDERGFTQPGFGFHDEQNVEPYCWGGSTEEINQYMRSLRTLRTIVICASARKSVLRCKSRLAIKTAASDAFISMRALKILHSAK
jgi:TIR domain